MPSCLSASAVGPTMWLRPLALAVVALGIVADHGRVLLDSTGQCIIRSNGPLFDRFGNAAGLPFLDPFFCLLLGFFREILIYPAGRAVSGICHSQHTWTLTKPVLIASSSSSDLIATVLLALHIICATLPP